MHKLPGLRQNRLVTDEIPPHACKNRRVGAAGFHLRKAEPKDRGGVPMATVQEALALALDHYLAGRLASAAIRDR